MKGVSYDISELASTNAAWTWNDPSDFLTTNSTYTFNICADVPASLKPAGCPTGSAPAYQVDGSGNCYRLGASFTYLGRQPVYADFIDAANPARGVKFTYTGGDVSGGCPADIDGGGRAFTLSVLCSIREDHEIFPPATAPQVDTQSAHIDEVNVCDYEAFVASSWGCPLECPRVGGKVCGGNGICSFDSTQQAARCFCYDNWMEADCQTPRYPFPGGSVAGALFGGALVGALGVLGFAYYKARKEGASPQVGGFY